MYVVNYVCYMDVKKTIGCKVSSKYSDLLCKIRDLQDPTITTSSWIQDPQDPVEYFLSEIRSKIPMIPRQLCPDRIQDL